MEGASKIERKKCQLLQCLQNKGQKKDHCKVDSKNTLKYNDLTFLIFVKIVIKLQFHEAQWTMHIKTFIHSETNYSCRY